MKFPSEWAGAINKAVSLAKQKGVDYEAPWKTAVVIFPAWQSFIVGHYKSDKIFLKKFNRANKEKKVRLVEKKNSLHGLIFFWTTVMLRLTAPKKEEQ